ncbi:hypothetical protein, partial [uncultured Acidaminococcus sp.]|uniref:hypothetical protein n=1 Tax=uncultured Acidaminococcus sp. TaxID=352152 RepID=UPI00261BDE6B
KTGAMTFKTVLDKGYGLLCACSTPFFVSCQQSTVSGRWKSIFQINFEMTKTMTHQTSLTVVQRQHCWLPLAVDR